jgi:hypothetical protein
MARLGIKVKKKNKRPNKADKRKQSGNKSCGAVERFTNPGRGPLARKVISAARLELERKVISLKDWAMVKTGIAEVQKTVVLPENLKNHDPVHACYTMAQNQLSVMIEQLLDLPELEKLAHVYSDAVDEYMPEGPPISPLTGSYFTCWGSFDLSVGRGVKESLTTVLIDFCRFRNVNEDLLALLEKIQNSRMGIYRHEGFDGKFVCLRELITDKEVKTVSPSGYSGKEGELWYVRVLPPPYNIAPFNYSTIFTTPYILGNKTISISENSKIEEGWLQYFARNLEKTRISDTVQAYEYLLKYGLGNNYWNEYILLAYTGHQHDAIWLTGFPDIPSSLPHANKELEIL